MKIVKKILHIFLTIAVFTVLPIAVFTLVTSKTNIISSIQSFVVLTGSMEPTLPVGSIIYTQKQYWYPKGEIIAFKNGEVTITHRVVEVTNQKNTLYYKTRGDVNNTTDSEILTDKDIIGKQMFFIPYVGKSITFLKTPLGFAGLIVFPITVFLVFELWHLKTEMEKEMEKKIRRKLQVFS